MKFNKQTVRTLDNAISQHFFLTLFQVNYCKIPLIHPGRIYRQRINFMDLYLRGLIYGWPIFARKNTSIWNLLNVLDFLFSSIKHVFLNFFTWKSVQIRKIKIFRYEKYSQLTIKTPEYKKLTIKLKINTLLTSCWSLYCTAILLLTLIS